MPVLITGSTGWLGRHLVPLLRAAGREALGLDAVAGPHTEIVGSVADPDLVASVFEQHPIDAVIHAAALHKPDLARHPTQAFVDVNVTGTLNLLRHAARRPGTPFVFTSTTSLMISQAIREEQGDAAVWLDESAVPLEPRNAYGVTKLAAEGLCRVHHLEHGLPVVILRTARFFPEEDDTHRELCGPNMKANELLHRRATTRDMARAHLAALDGAAGVGFGLYVVSAPTPFAREDVADLKRDAAGVIDRLYPEAADLYEQRGWSLPRSIGRVYDGTRITRELGFGYETTFTDVLAALRDGRDPPLDHDAAYVSPMVGG